MEKSTCYVDIDDTLLDTTTCLLNTIRGHMLPVTPDKLYGYMTQDNMYGTLIRERMSNYLSIPFMSGAETALNLLMSEYNVVLYSGFHLECEKIAKKRFANHMGLPIVQVFGRFKGNLDMQGSIYIDNDPEVMLKSNADVKYEIFDANFPNFFNERDDRTVVCDWFSLIDMLFDFGEKPDISIIPAVG